MPWLVQSVLGFARGVLTWVTDETRWLAAAAITWSTHQVEASLVRSLEDLQICNHSVIDGVGNLKYSHSTFSFVTKDHTVHCGCSSMKLTLEIANKSLKLVPDKDVYPQVPLHIKRVRKIDSSHVMKGPVLTFYEELGGLEMIATLLLQEAEMLEQIERNAHPNILRHWGCQVHQGRIVGLALRRYPRTLEERMRDSRGDVDWKPSFDGLKSIFMHLHSPGLTHNGIKASDIMVAEDETWILADIGFCRPFGDRLIIAGNPL